MTQTTADHRAGAFWAIIADTFQEARARWLFWGLFGLSTLLILLFLFVLGVDVVQGARVTIEIGPASRDVFDINKFVHQAYSWITIVLYIWGTLLAVFASAGLVPVLLESGRIALLLSKPISRSRLLLGRYVGNVLIIGANHTYLILSIWLILGSKTQIWDPRFLLAIPISVFMFSVLLCVVVLVGVVLESAALSIMAAVALMLISTLLAQLDWSMRLLSSEWSRQLWVALYWIVPKVYDLAGVMKQLVVYDRDVDWFTPVWTSAAFAIATLSSAVLIFRKRDF
ncbi:MAG: ABC transporter permease subunit [Acidobacteriaceae bacterium]|nr:ABC transporter permease subunit [Acidobacteriaceae bacterium]